MNRVVVMIGVTALGLLQPCGAAGAVRPDSASAIRGDEVRQLTRRVVALRQERRMRLRATALSSEMGLFDEGAALVRSVSAPEIKGTVLPPGFSRAPEIVVRSASEGAGEAGHAVFRSDLEALEAEIRALEARLIRNGGQKS